MSVAAPPAGSRIFVGIPVYRGWDYVGESLRSLQVQTWTGFKAFISVDGDDRRSAEACREFLADGRFEMAVHDRRLGWVGNFNWLLQRSDGDFFCYFQQDDLLDPSYLASLLDVAARHPSAAVAYCQMEYFGGRRDLHPAPSLTGDPLSRAIGQIDALLATPFRGLIRRDAVREAGLLNEVDTDGFGEDVIWIAKLACAGEIRGFDRLLYWKRWHESNTSRGWGEWSQERRRTPWIVFCAGLLEAVLPAAPSQGARRELFLRVLERLATDAWFFDAQSLSAPERSGLIVDFVENLTRRRRIDSRRSVGVSPKDLARSALGHFGLHPPPEPAWLPNWLGNPVGGVGFASRRPLLTEGPPRFSRMHYRMSTPIDFRVPSARNYLQGAWGHTELEGVWTTGAVAGLTIWPEAWPDAGALLRAFVLPFLAGSHRKNSVDVFVDGNRVASWSFDLDDREAGSWRWCEARLPAMPRLGPVPITLVVRTPVSPSSLGALPFDERTLGVCLQTLIVTPVA